MARPELALAQTKAKFIVFAITTTLRGVEDVVVTCTHAMCANQRIMGSGIALRK